MKKIVASAAEHIKDIDTYAIRMFYAGMILADLLFLAGCVCLLIPSLSGSVCSAYYNADQLCETALRTIVMGCIFGIIADVIFRGKY